MNKELAIVVFLMLAIPAISDIRSRDFLVLPPVLLFLAGLILKIALLIPVKSPGILSGESLDIRLWLPAGRIVSGLWQECRQMAAGMLPGAAFFLLNHVSPQSAGTGDAFLILLLGILCGFTRTLFGCLTALGCISLYGAAAALRRGKWENMTLPFLPFLLAGYLVSLVCF